MSDQPVKWWLDSRTVRGGLMTLIPTVQALLKMFGVELPPGALEPVVDLAVAVCGVYGLVEVVLGRLEAKHTLTLQKPE